MMHKKTIEISPVSVLLDELKAGRMIILVDDEDRENEGDLLMAAEKVSANAINFMVKFARGLVCLTLTEERCKQLNLTPMVTSNGSPYGTNFTISIEAARGVSTGISASDRSMTIQAATAPNAKPDDLVQPGHIFPLKAQKGGVLSRAGHTEAGCDLTTLAGLTPAAVICEIMNEDGTMARLPDLKSFAHVHQLKIGTIADLIQYRLATESLIQPIYEEFNQSAYPDFKLALFKDLAQGGIHAALILGTPIPDQETWVRVHQPTSILDFILAKGPHSYEISQSIEIIRQQKHGVLVLLNCEEGGHRILEKLKQTQQNFFKKDALTQEQEISSLQLRNYGIGAQILRHIGVGKMKLLAHPTNMPSLTGFGIEVVGYHHHL